MYGDQPEKFHPLQHPRRLSQDDNINNFIFSEEQIKETHYFEMRSDVGRQILPFVSYQIMNRMTSAVQSHLGKYAYAANYLIQVHKWYKHMLIPRKMRYKHMLMQETTCIKYISGISIFS